MLNGRDLMMLFSLIVIVICMFIIIYKFIYYFNNTKQILSDQRNNTQNIEILQAKMTEMKLKNKGHSIDENIKLIYNDEKVIFLMEWRNIIG